jgi:hypothetical protein
MIGLADVRPANNMPAEFVGTAAAGLRSGLMNRYHFNITDGSPFRDPEGEVLANDHAAWIEALRTVRDVESTLDLERSPRWSIEVKRDGTPIFRIDVSAQKCPQ